MRRVQQSLPSHFHGVLIVMLVLKPEVIHAPPDIVPAAAPSEQKVLSMVQCCERGSGQHKRPYNGTSSTKKLWLNQTSQV